MGVCVWGGASVAFYFLFLWAKSRRKEVDMSLPARSYGTQSSENPFKSRKLALFAIKYLPGLFHMYSL